MLITYNEPGLYRNPINLCSIRNDSDKVNAIIQENTGSLFGEAGVIAMKTQNYAIVLQKIWAEPNTYELKRWLNWQGFAPFISQERAFVELKIKPSKETFLNTSLPFLRLGDIRLRMDAACANDPSLKWGCDHVENVYVTSLISLAEELDIPLDINNDEIIESLSSTVSLVQRQLNWLECVQKSLPKERSLGKWVFKQFSR